MFNLPIDIQRLIFAFDTTYRKIYQCILYELEFVTPFWIIHPENISQQYYHTPTFKTNKARLYHKQAENLINFNHQSFPTRTTDLNCWSLFDLYPNENEGVLDKRFAALVNRKICCEIGWSIGIHNFVITGSKKKMNIYATVLQY